MNEVAIAVSKEPTLQGAGEQCPLPVLEPLVNWIKARGLQEAARFLVEMHRPLRGIAAAGITAFSPLLLPFLKTEILGALVQVLEDEQLLEQFLRALEE